MKIEKNFTRDAPPWRVRCQAVVVLICVAAGLFAVALRNPHEAGNFPTCVYRYLTGWLCPGCGSIRMLHHLLHGNFAVAVRYNPVAFAFLPVMILEICNQFILAVYGKNLYWFDLRPWMRNVALILLICWGIVRNFFDSIAAH